MLRMRASRHRRRRSTAVWVPFIPETPVAEPWSPKPAFAVVGLRLKQLHRPVARCSGVVTTEQLTPASCEAACRQFRGGGEGCDEDGGEQQQTCQADHRVS